MEFISLTLLDRLEQFYVRGHWRHIKRLLNQTTPIRDILMGRELLIPNDCTLLLHDGQFELETVLSWLNDPATLIGSYDLGAYLNVWTRDNLDRRRFLCTGDLAVQFEDEVDAIHFKLRWGASQA